MSDKLAELKAQAAAQVALYPQYKNSFDNCRLARMKRVLKTHGSVAADEGEVVLYFPGEESIIPHGRYAGKTSVLIWSMNKQIRTSIFDYWVELI